MKHKTFLKNAAVLSLGGVIAKGIGALYRIPLAAILGGYGTGLYHMAYPLFCVLLTFSSAGIPSAFSRMLAGELAAGRDGRALTRSALRLFAVLGFLGTLCMGILAPVMSEAQGDGALLPCYLALAPAVFFVALIAVLRGYFQGRRDMAPTALSEIVEQLFKAGAGLFFALRFPDDPVRAVVFSLAAVSLSEFAALLFLWRRYAGEPRRPTLLKGTGAAGILSAAFPVMAAASLLPLSQMADSVIVVRLLSLHSARAVALYGLFAGGAVSLVNLPASACAGFSVAAVPAVAARAARGDAEAARERAVYALFFTILLSAPCAVALFFLAGPAAHILYSSLPAEDLSALIGLTKLLSVSAVTSACVNTLSACLTGMGRAKHAALSMLAAVLVKLVLEFLLLPRPALSVYGAAIAVNACYLVAFFLDLFYTVRKKEVLSYDHGGRLGNGAGGRLAQGDPRPQGGGRDRRANGGTMRADA